MRLAEILANDTQATDLYRYYDNANRLLYVGVSVSAIQRAEQHAREAAWWPDWVTMRRERHGSRALALAAERHAIEHERPQYNIVHSTRTVINLRQA